LHYDLRAVSKRYDAIVIGTGQAGPSLAARLAGGVSVDMKRVKARKDEIVRRSNQGVEKWMRGLKDTTVYSGHARFEGPQAVRIGSDLLEAERIFINVGGRARAVQEIIAKAPAGVLQRAVHIHPTVAELIPTVLGELKPLA
jgi:pyruvate/2-oxoglutarate dehydrogenase complex dihydrolipoamide dehydrogenase (E3) component